MVEYSYLYGLRLCFRIRLIYRDGPVFPEWGVEPFPAPLEQKSASDPLALPDVAEAGKEASVERSSREFAMFQEERGGHSGNSHGPHVRLISISKGQSSCIRRS